MAIEPIHTDRAPRAIGPYSQAIRLGEMIYCSGQVALDPATGQLVEGDVQAQTRRALENLAAVLSEAGASLGSVLKTTVFLAQMGDFQAMNETYAEHFGEHKPARSTIQAAGLPRGALVEIECIAVRTSVDPGVRG